MGQILAYLKAQDNQLKPVISAGTTSRVADIQNISIDDNAGKVGAGNEVDIEGGLGRNSNLGNTTNITVKEKNTDTGRIGADNKYKIKGGLKNGVSVGNISDVVVGNNSGSIGAGNKINIR
ncbi:hypothetical protein PFLUV_G00190470 [Perca fluviatilis]|uniref:Uncharacterized protein n=1 Tax=Perca fluviatilis TaxID=8168 RepID=A0A6A5EC11_PERFL|nr:hypothetical protein PFLUV_G00190470 [Perca fluviatilis]